MKTWKKMLAIFLAFMIFIFTTSICEREAEASVGTTIITVAGAVVTAYELAKIHQEAYESYNSGSWKKVQDWAVRNFGPIGFIMTVNPEAELIDRVLKPFLRRQGIIAENDTDEEAFNKWSSYVNNHYHLENNGEITYDESMKNTFNGLIDSYINDSGYTYVYSYDLRLFLSDTNNGDIYNATKDFVLNNQNTNYIYMCSNLNEGGTLYLYMCPMNSDYALINLYDYGNYYSGRPYKFSDWNYNIQMARYQFNRDTNTWDFIRNDVNDGGLNPSVKKENDNLKNYSVAYWLTCNGVQSQVLFYSLIDMKKYSQGELPYYFNNSVYNDWSQSSGDYIVTTDNSNTVTYGDITNYIGNSYNETGNYPSVPDINNFIENYIPNDNPTPTPNPDNPSGSGSFVNNNNPSITNNPTFNNNPNINITLFPSVSDNGLNGGTVSGNGGHGSIGNIFEWIGNLGNVIANLIKNVGEMIVNALQGVIEAVTTILNGIPNILTPIIEFVFGGLPDELQALISLGITCIIFVGIIKVIKR